MTRPTRSGTYWPRKVRIRPSQHARLIKADESMSSIVGKLIRRYANGEAVAENAEAPIKEVRVDVHPEVWRLAKARSAREGRSISEAVRDMIGT